MNSALPPISINRGCSFWWSFKPLLEGNAPISTGVSSSGVNITQPTKSFRGFPWRGTPPYLLTGVVGAGSPDGFGFVGQMGPSSSGLWNQGVYSHFCDTRESPPVYGVLVFGKPNLLYHRSGFHFPQPWSSFILAHGQMGFVDSGSADLPQLLRRLLHGRPLVRPGGPALDVGLGGQRAVRGQEEGDLDAFARIRSLLCSSPSVVSSSFNQSMYLFCVPKLLNVSLSECVSGEDW